MCRDEPLHLERRLGGFGAEAGAKLSGAMAVTGKITEATVEQVNDLLRASHSVIVVPGYGMAVARAQHAVRDLTNELTRRGVKTRYAIHPVAGRLPGHMNVLLAEADVPYDIVHEMDEINGDFANTDTVLVIGANDIVNPSAQTDTGSLITECRLEAWKAGGLPRARDGGGGAGVDNPLCYGDNTMMLRRREATVTGRSLHLSLRKFRIGGVGHSRATHRVVKQVRNEMSAESTEYQTAHARSPLDPTAF